MKWTVRVCVAAVMVLHVFAVAATAAVNPAAQVVLDKGVEFYEQGQLQEASAKFVQVVEIDPEAAPAYYYLGQILLKTNQAAKGLGFLDKAYHLDPGIPGLRVQLASLYQKIGKPALALTLLGEAHASAPDDAAVAVQYGKLLVEQGDFSRGESVFNRLLAQGTESDAAHFYLGVIRAGQQFPASAYRHFEQVDKASPYGDPAAKYMDGLAPAVRPVKLFASSEYYYNDNPEADAVTMVPGQVFGQDIKGSGGYSLVGSVSTPGYELAERWQMRLGYLYYGNFYLRDFARDNDYEGHFVTPTIGFRFGDRCRLDLEGRYSQNNFNEQAISDVVRVALKYSHVFRNKFSFFSTLGWQGETYSDGYRAPDTALPESLAYKDTDNLLLEVGGKLLGKDGYGSVTWSAGYTEALTRSQDDLLLELKTDDYRHRDYSFAANLTVPCYGVLERLAFKADYSIRYRDYLNTQSGLVYGSAVGKDIDEVSVTFSGELQYQLWKPANLAVVAGAQHKTNESEADELVYNQNRYYLKLSAGF